MHTSTQDTSTHTSDNSNLENISHESSHTVDLIARAESYLPLFKTSLSKPNDFLHCLNMAINNEIRYFMFDEYPLASQPNDSLYDLWNLENISLEDVIEFIHEFRRLPQSYTDLTIPLHMPLQSVISLMDVTRQNFSDRCYLKSDPMHGDNLERNYLNYCATQEEVPIVHYITLSSGLCFAIDINPDFF